MIDKSNIKDLYPLSPMQEGMLFHALENPDSRAYFEQVSYRVSGPLRIALFVKAWNYLVERHDILRTAFLHERTKQPLQVVLKQRPMPIVERDLRGLQDSNQEEIIAAEREADKARQFDLREEPLLRASVFILHEDSYEIIFSFHHILMDGWCMGMLNAEFLQVYECLRAGELPALSPPLPYQRYIQWLERQDRVAAVEYWRRYLTDLEAASLPRTRLPNAEAYRLQRLHTEVDARKFRETAARWGVTLNTVLQTAWALVLSRYTNSNDVVFGAIVSGRPAEIPGVEQILGLFINLIPVRVQLEGVPDVRTLAERLQSDFLEAEARSYCSIGEITVQAGRRGTLFDHIIVFENYPDVTASSGLLQIQCTDRFEQTNYDFVIVVTPGESIDIAFHFNAHVFDQDFIGRLQTNYLRTLELLVDNPGVREIEIVSDTEREILTRWGHGPQQGSTHGTLVERFEQQVSRTVDAIAVSDDGVSWTYAELNARADVLACSLQAQGVQAEDRVMVVAPRSRWLPLALLGVMKAGAVYLPVDPETPLERIRFYREDSGAKFLLTASDLESLSSTPVNFPRRQIDPEQLAYMIYTSGSTGMPKAVAVPHCAAGNLVDWHLRAFDVDKGSRATLFASPGFDASLWEMLPYLVSGGRLFPVPGSARTDASKLLRFYAGHGITHSFVPPTVAEELGRSADDGLNRVRILAGGDVLKSSAGLARLYNNYGPTESAVVATSIHVTGTETRIPIGRPIDNTGIMILDGHGRLAPIDVPGELHISSASLARGYLGHAALTAEKFIPHPQEPGARVYRTGDLGYWHDGAIHFVGRNDRQVKVAGVRMELGEIEAALELHPLVGEAAAGIIESGSLIAWVVPRAAAIDTGELPRFLAVRLPAAMIPTRFVSLDEMPRTSNGKVDRVALSARLSAAEPRRLPHTERQHDLAALWSEVLNINNIALDDDFFTLGGHSLSVTRLVSRIRDRFQVDLPVRAVFEAGTLARLEEVIAALPTREAAGESEPKLVSRRRETRKPVLEGNKA